MLASIRIIRIYAIKIFQSPRNKNHTGRNGSSDTKGNASHAKPVLTALTYFDG